MQALNNPQTPSMSPPSASDDWPQQAVPQAWIEELFRKLASYFGARLADMWANAGDLESVKREWGIALSRLSRNEWKAGVGALLTLKYPPTLPEFYGLCKQQRLVELPRSEQLTDQTRADPNVVFEHMPQIRAYAAAIFNRKEGTAEWAFQLLMRGESKWLGKPLTAEVVRCATDAITSAAGRAVVENCTDPELREHYAEIRQTTVDGYRMRGLPLWSVK